MIEALHGILQVSPLELSRAKNQTRSSVFMNLESRGVVCEEVGRQLLMHGRVVEVGEIADEIEKIGIDDVCG